MKSETYLLTPAAKTHFSTIRENSGHLRSLLWCRESLYPGVPTKYLTNKLHTTILLCFPQPWETVFSHGSIPSLHYYWVSAHHLCSLPGITSCITFSLMSLSSLSCPPDVRCLLYCQISTPGPGKPVNTHLAIDILSRPPAPYSAKNALTPTKGHIYQMKSQPTTFLE